MDIAKLTVALYANSAQFVSEMDKAKKKSKDWGDTARKSASIAAATTAAAATTIVAALTLIYKQQSAVIDQTAKFADRIGITTENLTRFRHASELTGVGQKNLDMSLQRMTRRIAEAAAGAGEAAPALKQLGLDAETLGRMTPEQQLYELADAFTKVDSQSARVRLAFKLFDSEGVGMVNMLAGGKAGLKAMADEADILGITLSRVDAAKVEMANDAMYKIGLQTTALHQNITTELAPVLAGLSEEFIRFSRDYGGMNNLVADSLENMAMGAGKFGDLLRGIHLTIKSLQVAWVAFKSGFLLSTQAMITAVSEVGRKIYSVMVYPTMKALEAMGSMSDDAAKYAAALKGFGEFEPVVFYDQTATNQARLDMNQAIFELRTLAAEEMPSTGIEKWFATNKKRYQELAEEYAKSINYNQASDAALPDVKAPAKPKAVKASTAALDAFKATTAALQQEQQRRATLLAVGENQAAVQEAFNYQDRYNALSQQFQAAYEQAKGNHALMNELETGYFASRENLHAIHQANLSQIEADEAARRQEVQQQVAANLLTFTQQQMSITTNALKDAGKENSTAYKVLLAIQKAAALPQMMVATELASVQALAAAPPPYSFALAAAVKTLGYASMGVVAGQAISGMAHNGISSVPREGTWLLDQGERVYTNESANQIDAMYMAVMSGQGARGEGVTKVVFAPVINMHGDKNEDQIALAERTAKAAYNMVLQDVSENGQIRRRLGI
ncbi:hypothetical protein K6Y31_20705 [Motilimonas cestriensis]|uniref:Bacteriophage tail tape measure C-terminal domain-containing protein n=1 Tax=Motilimonas cestriensis TaxID=2742685 RepID=A0ABS8WHJ1_9GAMM|nr:hypothetical protein [Motilimonas cestriensis]MCE2597198.1 hypothetical protein [Motilimonas cestriensis]